METEHNEFEQLRKLLALKRHEQPPPRYFSEFSSGVLARLRTLEKAPAATWWQRFGLDLDLKPALMGACGVVVCGLLLVGVITSLGSAQPSVEGFAIADVPVGLMPPSAEAQVFAGGVGLQPVLRPEEVPASTIPVGNANSPFAIAPHRAEPANYRFGAGE
jgi:hypothetical protein